MSKTKIIAIANQKGGVGKTTTTINLAACLGDLGVKVLVIDLDPQANATSGLGMPKEEGQSLYQALLNDKIKPKKLIQKTPYRNVDIIPSELDLAGAEIEVARMDGCLDRFKMILEPIREKGKYQFVFVDCPPSLGVLTMNALNGCDSMLLPIQCEYYALEGLSTISKLAEKFNDIAIEGILMTMYDQRTNLASSVEHEVRTYFGEKVYKTLIPRNVRLSEAPSHGQPIIAYDDYCLGAKAYRQFAEEFADKYGIKY
jgi:chromosome partitioning protein